MSQIVVIGLIGIAGALGALARYGVSLLTKHWFGTGFPVGTLLVNVAGCFLLGVIAHLTSQHLSEHWRTILGVGFLGALTTFSTFGVETISKFNDGETTTAVLNVIVNLVLGLSAVLFGILVAKSFGVQVNS